MKCQDFHPLCLHLVDKSPVKGGEEMKKLILMFSPAWNDGNSMKLLWLWLFYWFLWRLVTNEAVLLRSVFTGTLPSNLSTLLCSLEQRAHQYCHLQTSRVQWSQTHKSGFPKQRLFHPEIVDNCCKSAAMNAKYLGELKHQLLSGVCCEVLLSFDDLIVFNPILTVNRIQGGDIAPLTSLTCLNFQWKH